MEQKREIKGFYVKNATSSNDVARDLVETGAPEGTYVIVECQSKGRGRMGRTFISNEPNGLYMSIILKPHIAPSQCQLITVLLAVAVRQAILKTSGIETKIKWVNDIYKEDKKICGILVEGKMTPENDRFEYLVCGIGVNIEPPQGGFNEEIKDIAEALYPLNQSPKNYKALLTVAIIEELFKYYDEIERREYLEIYKNESYLINKEVNVYVGNETVGGTVTDFDENGNLIILGDDGQYHGFYSGEARVRKK